MTDLKTNKARQATRGKPVLYVLLASLCLAAIALFVVDLGTSDPQVPSVAGDTVPANS